MNILQSLNKENTVESFNYRFRRDVLEGTFEEMLDNEHDLDIDFGDDGNSTILREKRQAEFPGAPEQDTTK